ncbi:hypothetical protein C0Z19_25885 [Trinickia soli]|uniref:Uncharacterized protein n=1 Tax=Trinickia soli TaxID=380675 RepID=A0A2N7VH03_9BURK|nr:hypothetical protein CIW54_13895 [Paraburkholderia sp. T12-10]PMS16432.1 hypothetical protein C0Z19_25885 [Trinickia soli]
MAGAEATAPTEDACEAAGEDAGAEDADAAEDTDAGFPACTPLGLAAAAGGEASAAVADAAPEALPEAADGAASLLTTAPVASSGGTFSTAPSFNRLGSLRINADGFASKMAFAARLITALSCD